MATRQPIRYLSAEDVWALNHDILSQEGSTSLLRDRGALESALMRPQMAAHYEQADIVTQAALLIAGIAMAHPFLDGNKRAATAAGVVFLGLNGYYLDISPTDDSLGRQVEALVNYPDTLDAANQRFIAWLSLLIQPKS